MAGNILWCPLEKLYMWTFHKEFEELSNYLKGSHFFFVPIQHYLHKYWWVEKVMIGYFLFYINTS